MEDSPYLFGTTGHALRTGSLLRMPAVSVLLFILGLILPTTALGSEGCKLDPIKERGVSFHLQPDGVCVYEKAANISDTSPADTPPFWRPLLNLFSLSTEPRKLPFQKSVAFLAGVGSSYAHIQPKLNYVENDIDRLREYLLTQGGFDTVYVVKDEKATPQLLDTYMTDTFRNILSPDDRLLFYFSGHGDDDGEGNGYLLFSQAVPGQFGHDVLSVDRYRSWSARIKAKHVLFIYDSCAAGLGLVEKAPQNDRGKIDAALMNTLAGSGSRQVLTAGTASEKALEIRISNERGYSVFTNAFLNILKSGVGEDPSQGFLTVEEVLAKASIDVGRFGVHPGYRKFDDQHRSGTFLFAKPLLPGMTLSDRERNALGLVQKRPDDARCWVHPVDGQEYCFIPKGTFEMGCADPTCTSAEAPHQVEAPNDFYIGRTEVTVKAYRRYIEHRRADTSAGMPPAPSHNRDWTKDLLPIVNVTSDEASGFCASIDGRLPTELEWERAAKAGKSTRFPWSNQEDSRQANFTNSGTVQPTPVGTYPKNDFDLFDVAGNVAEWTSDTYSVDGRIRHVVKGGSYLTRPMSLGSRLLLDDSPHADVGFRCVTNVRQVENANSGSNPSN